MIKYLVVLKGENKDFATKEFEELYLAYFNEKIKLEHVENILYQFQSKQDITNQTKFFNRLTLTNVIIKNITTLNSQQDLENFTKEYDFSFLENKNFCVKIRKSKKFKVDYLEKDLARPIFYSLKNPKVSIDNQDYEFSFVFSQAWGDVFSLGLKLFENNKEYLRRMPKLRPIKMPYTLKSDMARTSINLLGLKEGLICDPFCGIGGILLEAYDMGFDVLGNDISWNDLKYFKENFEYYYPGSSNKRIRTLADSQTQFLKDNSIDGLVCDIPYGRCCRRLGDDLYENFLKSASKYLKKNKRMVVVYANFVEFKELALKYFNEVYEINEYINKSMTRHILVLENSK